MKTIEIEGFKIETNLDEQDVFNRCLAIESIAENDEKAVIEKLQDELRYSVMLVVEEMIIGGKKCADFFYEHYKGYKDSSLEPFNWRETKKHVDIIYTGAQGGGEWSARIFK